MSIEHWQNLTDRWKPKSLEKILSHCHLSTTRPTCTGLGLNQGLRHVRLVTNRLSLLSCSTINNLYVWCGVTRDRGVIFGILFCIQEATVRSWFGSTVLFIENCGCLSRRSVLPYTRGTDGSIGSELPSGVAGVWGRASCVPRSRKRISCVPRYLLRTYQLRPKVSASYVSVASQIVNGTLMSCIARRVGCAKCPAIWRF
jgi:hypothetical protein